MDGAEVASNCLCSVRSCATCWCPDSELADAHRGECHYRRMAEVTSVNSTVLISGKLVYISTTLILPNFDLIFVI